MKSGDVMHLCDGAFTQRSTHGLNKSLGPNFSTTSAQAERESNSERPTEEVQFTCTLPFKSLVL